MNKELNIECNLFEELAAILEFDAGFTRLQAEFLAEEYLNKFRN